MTVWYPYYCKILVNINMTELKPGTVVRVVKADNSTYQAIYCGQKDQYFIVGSKNEDFCIKSFTDTFCPVTKQILLAGYHNGFL